jgi:hypothetical protein
MIIEPSDVGTRRTDVEGDIFATFADTGTKCIYVQVKADWLTVEQITDLARRLNEAAVWLQGQE